MLRLLWLADLRDIIDISALRCGGLSTHLGHQHLVRASTQVLAHLAALNLLGLAALAALKCQ